METKHTPTPWKVVPPMHGHPSEYQCVQIGEDERYTTLEMEPADAAFIVTACNSFESMRSSIDKFLNSDIGDDVASIIEEMKAALALANGEGK